MCWFTIASKDEMSTRLPFPVILFRYRAISVAVAAAMPPTNSAWWPPARIGGLLSGSSTAPSNPWAWPLMWWMTKSVALKSL